ncbi:VirK/YbjX family protein [Neisseriaceae bacterium B1]
MEKTFIFPSFRKIYTQTGYLSWQNTKFQVRKVCALKTIKQFEHTINQSPNLIKLLNLYKKISYPLLHTYLDKRFNSPKKRMDIFLHDVHAMQSLAQGRVFQHFLNEQAILLANIDEDLYYQLSINDLDINEGLWSLSLRNHEYECLYAASFGFLPNGQFLVTSLQGPRGENGKECVRQLTKKLHGLRPQHLTVALLQLLAKISGCTQIVGIPQDRQVKLRWKLKKRVSMNYDEFWQECGGMLTKDGYWILPKEYVRKPEVEIASKKRAMYRRRYQMLDNLAHDIHKNLHITL